jgi:vitamin K-dependent gamma-carboxylase-like protein
LSFQRRDPWIFNAGDIVVRLEALFLALSPCGAALSLDQRRRTGSFWSAQSRPVWPVRLLQVQLSIIYLASVQVKLSGQTWLQDSAVSYALRLEDMQRLPAPHWYTTNALMMNAATWGALAIELAVGVLVWNRRFRPWVLAAGVAPHLMIDINIEIGIFSYAMFVLYLAWISPDSVRRLPGTLKQAAAKSLALLRRHRLPDSTTAPRRHRINAAAEVDGYGHLDQSPGGNNAEVATFAEADTNSVSPYAETLDSRRRP